MLCCDTLYIFILLSGNFCKMPKRLISAAACFPPESLMKLTRGPPKVITETSQREFKDEHHNYTTTINSKWHLNSLLMFWGNYLCLAPPKSTQLSLWRLATFYNFPFPSKPAVPSFPFVIEVDSFILRCSQYFWTFWQKNFKDIKQVKRQG